MGPQTVDGVHESLREAEGVIGYTFRDRGLLEIALRHASSADHRLVSNERLEFLGDAVLGMVVCEYLYDTFPDLLEGELTKIKSAAVSRRTCAKISTSLGLEHLLVLGKGMRTKGALPTSLSAAALESIIGAIYLDAGLEEVCAFLLPLLVPHIERAAESGHQQNFKSVLQQYAQRVLAEQPVYHLLDEKGPDHEKCFHVRMEIGGRAFPGCWAPSKKQAEQQAALSALEELGLIVWDDDGHAVYDASHGALCNDNGDGVHLSDADDDGYEDGDDEAPPGSPGAPRTGLVVESFESTTIVYEESCDPSPQDDAA